MRHEVVELEVFPKEGAINISVDLIRRISPDSNSVMEFKHEIDLTIVEKMLKFPLLGEKIDGAWNLSLTREFHLTDDRHLFKTTDKSGRLPLFEGKMIHQFSHRWGEPKYWIVEKRAGRLSSGETSRTKAKSWLTKTSGWGLEMWPQARMKGR